MNPSRLFIERPVATGLLMLAILLSGLLGLRLLPLSALPQVDFPTLQVQTFYPGASPEVMARTVTAPLERQFGQMASLQRMSSTSAAGVSTVTLQFLLSASLDSAEQEVQAALHASSASLPADLPAPPVYAKVNPADAPVLTLAVSSDSLPLTEVQDLVNTRLAQQLSQVAGVGQVSLSGGHRPAVRIQADTQALAAKGLGIDTLRNAIAAATASGAKGSFDGPTRATSINASHALLSADDYRRLVVSWSGDAPVRLGDVARVSKGAEDEQLGAWAGRAAAAASDGGPALLRPAIIVDVRRQPGANVIRTVDAIQARLPELRLQLPATVDLEVLGDRTRGIRASVQHVQIELVLAVVMVVLVIFLFLRDLRATLIASLAVPISLVGACGAMWLLGFSLNTLSLMALTIATGFVVDDAIVMLENIARHLERGRSAMQAALEGAREIGFTIVSLTVSLVAVLIPLLFMGDVVGRLFREFAITLALSILISAVVSLTLVPTMAARWLRAPRPQARPAPGATPSRLQRLQARMEARYDGALRTVLAHQGLTLWVALGTLALTVALYLLIPKGLFPTQDTGQLRARVEAAEGVSYTRMQALQRAAAEAVLADPDVATLSSVVGVDGTNNTMLHTGSLRINLKPGHAGQATVMQRLRERVAQVPGVRIHLQPVQDLSIDTETGPTEFRASLEGADTASVEQAAQRLVARLQQDPRVRHPVTDAGLRGPAAVLDIDRDTAARLGLSAATIDDALYSAFGQRIVATLFTEHTPYRVILEASRAGLSDPAALADLRLSTRSGAVVPLSAFATVREERAPLQITHVAQYPGASIGFDTAPGVSLGEAVTAVREAARDTGLPVGVSLSFLGAAGSFEQSLGSQLVLILAAVVCVYIVLGVLYESYVHPLTILSTLPSAGVGALLALMLGGHALGVIGIIGIILLIGIVKKNAIMMIDFAIEAQRHGGLSAQQAIHQAALRRLRPILMTTFAALFAALPLMFSWGDGAELRRPLGLAIFGGLVLSQLLTLFTTPAVYLAFDRLAAGRRARQAAQAGAPDAR